MSITCDECGRYLEVSERITIYKEVDGHTIKLKVCPECAEKHKKETETARDNYDTLFGPDWH